MPGPGFCESVSSMLNTLFQKIKLCKCENAMQRQNCVNSLARNQRFVLVPRRDMRGSHNVEVGGCIFCQRKIVSVFRENIGAIGGIS
jgi:hypothetical protein